MKHAVSISLGSSSRDKRVMIELMDQKVVLERIGTDGDIEMASRLFNELDGKVDALGVGGIDLWVGTAKRKYPLTSAHRLVKGVRVTPVVDGGGLKNTLERQSVQILEREIGRDVQPKRAMNTAAIDRYGMTLGLVKAGYDVVFCDLMFALGLPIPIQTLGQLEILAFLLLPIVGRLPIDMLYPTGERQNENVPKFTRWYDWATLIAGDCNYIKRHMPADLGGKTVLTNTTTEADVEVFRHAGVAYLVTTTPRLEGRSFGTNMMEAALVAVSGKNRPLMEPELVEMIAHLQLEPNIERLSD